MGNGHSLSFLRNNEFLALDSTRRICKGIHAQSAGLPGRADIVCTALLAYRGQIKKWFQFLQNIYLWRTTAPQENCIYSLFAGRAAKLVLEYHQNDLMSAHTFSYHTNDFENERASNSYLMSTIAVIVGLPLPIVNLIATTIFYFNNRSSTYFVRWHCLQALLSQILIVGVNSIGFSWTMTIIFGDNTVSNSYIAYIITIVFFNLVDFFANIYAAIKTRKGNHIVFWFIGPLTNALCKS